MIPHTQLYLSTIDPNASRLARQYHLGLEIAEYCTAYNMDDCFSETDTAVRDQLQDISRRLLHGPFNELFPCAIDPKARALAADRYGQAITLAQSYHANKIVIHGGYNPHIYYPCWYVEQSVVFWKQFLSGFPEQTAPQIVLENVLEENPEMLLELVRQVDDPRLRLCLDIGHANAYSHISVMTWLETLAPFLSHFHIHNNDGSRDSHSGLNEGTVQIQELLSGAKELCPDATYTLELPEAEPSLKWLFEW